MLAGSGFIAPGGAQIVTPVSRRDMGQLDGLARGAASQERYRTLFMTMPQGVVHYDADGSIIGVNRRPARSWA